MLYLVPPLVLFFNKTSNCAELQLLSVNDIITGTAPLDGEIVEAAD